MGLAMELVSGRATAPGSTLTALTMAAGNSLTVRNTNFNTKIYLVNMWAENNAAGIFRVRSPKLHDNVQGIRYRIDLSDPVPLMPLGSSQILTPQDTLIAEISGSSTGGQIEQGQLLIWYADLPGSNARLANWSQIQNRVVNFLTVEVAITPGSTGGYSGQVAINSTFDLLQANTDYAILGGMVDVRCAAVRITGPDFANFGVGFPGYMPNRNFPGRFFYNLNEELGLPTIPIFNSANKNGTLVDVVQDQTGNAVNVTLNLVQLSSQ
jgi:hypothetical protein